MRRGWVRMLRLMERPADIPALAPVYEREILYRVLQGPHGWMLRDIAVPGTALSRISVAIQWIRENFTRPLRVEALAAMAALSVSAFHRHFKAVTAIERRAGRFMRAPDHDAATGTGDGAVPPDNVPGLSVAEGNEAPAGEQYQLVAGDGQDFDGETFALVEPIFREIGLDNEQAQKLVSAYGEKVLPMLAGRTAAQSQHLAATARREWAEAFDADPDLGGNNRDSTLADAARAFDHYGMCHFKIIAALDRLQRAPVDLEWRLVDFVNGGSHGGSHDRLLFRRFGQGRSKGATFLRLAFYGTRYSWPMQ